MQRGPLLLLLAALLLGGAAWMLVGLGGRATPAEAKVPETRSILVAAQPIPAGSRAGVSSLQWADWPARAVNDRHLVEGAADPRQLYGLVARRDIAAGEPLLAADLLPPGAGGAAAALLPAGSRAISLPVDAASGLSGLAGPGDRVDVILILGLSGGAAMGGRTVARTVVEDAPVIAVDGAVRRAGEVQAPQTVTLAVAPADAEALALARELGRLSLVLRAAGAPPPAEGRAPRWDRSVTGIDHALPAGAALAAPVAPALPVPAMAAAPTQMADAGPAPRARVERVRGVEVVRGSVEEAAPVPAPTVPAAPAEPSP